MVAGVEEDELEHDVQRRLRLDFFAGDVEGNEVETLRCSARQLGSSPFTTSPPRDGAATAGLCALLEERGGGRQE